MNVGPVDGYISIRGGLTFNIIQLIFNQPFLTTYCMQYHQSDTNNYIASHATPNTVLVN